MKQLFNKKIYSALLLGLGLLMSHLVSAQALIVKDPIAYATQVSKSFAEGDSNDDSGWNSCEYNNKDALMQIQCDGTREILVHGGKMFTRAFQCNFTFEPYSTDGESISGYDVDGGCE